MTKRFDHQDVEIKAEMSLEASDAAHKRLRSKNWFVFLGLMALVVLFFAITVIRMGAPLHEDEEMLDRWERFNTDSPHIEWSDEESARYLNLDGGSDLEEVIEIEAAPIEIPDESAAEMREISGE